MLFRLPECTRTRAFTNLLIMKEIDDLHFNLHLYLLVFFCGGGGAVITKIGFGFGAGLFDGGHCDWTHIGFGGKRSRIHSTHCRIWRGHDVVFGWFELAPQMLWQMRHKLLGLGGLQVLGSVGAIAAVAMAFGQTWQISVAIACILALSSTAIVLQTFAEKQLCKPKAVRQALPCCCFKMWRRFPCWHCCPCWRWADIRQPAQMPIPATFWQDKQAGWLPWSAWQR